MVNRDGGPRWKRERLQATKDLGDYVRVVREGESRERREVYEEITTVGRSRQRWKDIIERELRVDHNWTWSAQDLDKW